MFHVSKPDADDLRKLIDLPLPLRDDELVEIRDQVLKRHGWDPKRTLLVTAVFLGASAITILILEMLIRHRAGLWLAREVRIAAFVGILAASIALWRTRWFALEFRRQIRMKGFDFCVKCGYRLDNLAPDSAHCPECGAPHWPDTCPFCLHWLRDLKPKAKRCPGCGATPEAMAGHLRERAEASADMHPRL
ncbi:MAG: hypothetical protein SYC29_00365 [Planctomycetota bacterium]|nr:hypothetical protein [Planctomycetota bacterium]